MVTQETCLALAAKESSTSILDLVISLGGLSQNTVSGRRSNTNLKNLCAETERGVDMAAILRARVNSALFFPCI